MPRLLTLGPGFDTRSGNILSFLLPLFQEGQLSVTGKSMCTKTTMQQQQQLIYFGNMYVHLLGTAKLAITQNLMDDLRFYVLFNNISVISGKWVGDNERLCAME